MIYEWRVYEIVPGKGKELHERFAKHALRLFKKHGIKAVGFWTSHVGGTSNVLYYMLSFDNVAHLEKAWRAFRSDSEWRKVLNQTDRNGPLVSRTNSLILEPTSYSPMK